MAKFKIEDRRGMTLVECMVALAIISIVALTVAAGFSAAAAIVKNGIDLQNSVEGAREAAELSAAGLDYDDAHYTCRSSSCTAAAGEASVPGTIIDVTDNASGIVFHIFVPD